MAEDQSDAYAGTLALKRFRLLGTIAVGAWRIDCL